LRHRARSRIAGQLLQKSIRDAANLNSIYVNQNIIIDMLAGSVYFRRTKGY
jgi:hypothetical protein